MSISMENYKNDLFLLLKRKIYIGIIPFIFIGFMIHWLNYDEHHYDQWAIPILLFLLFIDFIIVYKYHLLIRFAELLTLVIFSVYHIAKFFTYTQLNQEPDFYMFWSALYFIFVFLALHNHKGFLFSLIIYMITVLLWVFGNDLYRIDLLNQVYISNLSYIVVLYYIQKLFSSFRESDVLKQIAYKDFLTDIGNRRMLDSWINSEIAKYNAQKSSFSIIFFYRRYSKAGCNFSNK